MLSEGDADLAPEDPTGELAWLRTSDGLLRGLIHGLNNRIASISAIVQVMAGRGASGVGLEETVLQEIERLNRVIDLLRLVPRRREEGAEALHIADLIPDLTEALSLHSELNDVTFTTWIAPDLLPACCPPSSLAHALCILMLSAGDAVERPASVEVRCSSSAEEILVEIVAAGEPKREPSGRSEIDPMAAERLMASSGARVRVGEVGDGGRQRIELRLPTLTEARRRGDSGIAL